MQPLGNSSDSTPLLRVQLPHTLPDFQENIRRTEGDQTSEIYAKSKDVFNQLRQQDNVQIPSLNLNWSIKRELHERFITLNERSEENCRGIENLQLEKRQRFNDVHCPKPTAAFQTCHAIFAYPEQNQLHANLISIIFNDQLTRTYFATQHPFPNDELYWLLCINNGSLLIDLTTESDHISLSSSDGKRGYVNLLYFPERDFPILLEKYEIRLREKTHLNNDPNYALYLYEIFNRETEKIEKTIHRLHFMNWKDSNGIDLITLETLVKIVLENFKPKNLFESPIVNCKAGVGRTGTLILASLLFESIRKGQITIETYLDDLDNLIHTLRQQRGVSVVQTFQQYFTLVKFCIVMLAKYSNSTAPSELFQSTIATNT